MAELLQAEKKISQGYVPPSALKAPELNFYMAISTWPEYWVSVGDFLNQPILKLVNGSYVKQDTLVRERQHVHFLNHMAWLPSKVWLIDKGEIPLRQYLTQCIDYGDNGHWILGIDLYELGKNDVENPRFMRFISAMRACSKQHNIPFDEGAWVQAASRTKPENMTAQTVVNCRKVN